MLIHQSLVFPSNWQTASPVSYDTLYESLKRVREETAFPICSNIKAVWRKQKGIQFSKLSSRGRCQSTELVCHQRSLGKFALKITDENNLACITNLMGCYIFKQMHFSPGSNTWNIIPHQVKKKNFIVCTFFKSSRKLLQVLCGLFSFILRSLAVLFWHTGGVNGNEHVYIRYQNFQRERRCLQSPEAPSTSSYVLVEPRCSQGAHL